jgi:hypothetical protein
MINRKIQAAVLSLALLLPSGTAFASYHRHHVSQAGGAAVGAIAGALLDRHKPLEGAAIGAAVGLGVQSLRNHQAHRYYDHRHHYYRTYPDRY